jgi:hypothetical protein
MKIKYKYKSNGIVIGHLWGGGIGTYPAVKLDGFESGEELLKEAERQLKEGSLDSGMGYEKLIGAALNIFEEKSIIYKGEIYTTSNVTEAFIGKMTVKELDILQEEFNGNGW